MNMMTLGALLLLVGGLMNTIPPLYTKLSGVFNGAPVIQVIIGILSLIIGILMIVKKGVFAT